MDKILSVDDNSANVINSAFEANLGRATAWSNAVTVNALSGQAVSVKHDLGSVPNMIHVEPWVSGGWWASDVDRRGWTKTLIAFHAESDGRYTVRAGRR